MTTPPPVWLPGDGFIDHRGRYYPEQTVRDALRAITEWWAALSESQRAFISHAAHLAELDAEIEAAVFGEDA